MRRSSFLPTVIAGLAAIAVVACGESTAALNSNSSSSKSTPDSDLTGPSADLTGAGSTFDQPFFTRAFFHYNQLNSGVTVTYASIGSGGGIAQFQAQTVDFGATDVPMGAADLAKAKGGGVTQVPVTLGGVAIAYNVSGLQTGLHLTSDVLTGIFRGEITSWDDPQIKTLNGGVSLPHQAITVVHRSDGSGTTYIFTDYLTTVDPDWASGPGKGKTVNWPVGVGGKGNEGVAGLVKQTPGSIGYVELAYALQNNFSVAAIKNKAGSFVQPSLDSVAADAAQKTTVSSADFSIVNQGGAKSYPISGYSWALVYISQKDTNKGTAIVKLLDWLTHAGQADAKAIEYVPLPANIQALARTALLLVVDSSGASLLK
jgi:phosphate transport system substrate-binding protein